jgi:hypothetical protein
MLQVDQLVNHQLVNGFLFLHVDLVQELLIPVIDQDVVELMLVEEVT